jgi:undecaprenyl phosphate N,N'-diacetylbacillosamine 1-phosphate transferase
LPRKIEFVYRDFLKPLFDFVVALIAFILLLPLFVLATVFLLLFNGGNPFFLQLRPGKNGELFKIMKFRTMNNKRDSKGELLPDASRLTPVGRFIRKTSLDEIPQLINVLKGDMSLAGPRPLLPEYLDIYTDYQKKRHDVRPGITGWAQVNGRNAISWNKKLELDVWYVENISLWIDFKIFWLTFLKVLKSEGVNTSNMATTERFNGRN